MIVPVLRKNKKYSLYNTYDDFKPEDRKFDLINISKLSREEFDFIGPFIEGISIAKIGEKSIFIKPNGQKLNTKEYYDLRNFENGIAAVCNDYSYLYDAMWTFINKNGIEIINQRFTSFRIYNNGFVEVGTYSGDYDCYNTGLMSINGNLLFEPTKSTTYFIHEKYIEVSGENRRSYKGAFYNFDGTQIKNNNLIKFEYIGHIRENRGIAQLKESREFVLIDNNFDVIKNLEIFHDSEIGEAYLIFEHVFGCHFYGKVCPIKKNNKWGLIDYNGNFVLNPKYDFIGGFTDIKMWESFSYGCAGVGKEIDSKMKYSAIDSNFKEISDFIYDEIGLFDEGIASVRIGEKWGAIDSHGEIVVPIEFSSIYYCNKGIIKVALGDFEGRRFFGKYGLYSYKGNKLTKNIYEELYVLENGFIEFKKDNKFGILNHEGKEVIRNIYDSIEYINQELLLAGRDNEKYYIDFAGREFRQKS